MNASEKAAVAFDASGAAAVLLQPEQQQQQQQQQQEEEEEKRGKAVRQQQRRRSSVRFEDEHFAEIDAEKERTEERNAATAAAATAAAAAAARPTSGGSSVGSSHGSRGSSLQAADDRDPVLVAVVRQRAMERIEVRELVKSDAAQLAGYFDRYFKDSYAPTLLELGRRCEAIGAAAGKPLPPRLRWWGPAVGPLDAMVPARPAEFACTRPPSAQRGPPPAPMLRRGDLVQRFGTAALGFVPPPPNKPKTLEQARLRASTGLTALHGRALRRKERDVALPPDAFALFRAAGDAAEALAPVLRRLAKKTRAVTPTPIGADAPAAGAVKQKRLPRAVEKAVKVYGGHLCCVKDLVRGELLYDEPARLLQALDVVVACPQLKLLRLKDTLTGAGEAAAGAGGGTCGYRCLTLHVLVGGGGDHICELQLHLAGLHTFKNRLASARRYARWRQSQPGSLSLVRKVLLEATLGARADVDELVEAAAAKAEEERRRAQHEHEEAKAKALADRMAAQRAAAAAVMDSA
jgi:hypothetical protein